MIIRPSPHKRQVATQSAAEWPPKSPLQALVSSPGGRQRWQQMANGLKERSPSPSSRLRHNVGETLPEEADGVSDEDESSLRLQLEILETKKRLRDIQKKHKRQADHSDGSLRRSPERNGMSFVDKSAKRLRLEKSPVRTIRQVDVPVSPVRAATRAEAPISPARVRLGLHGITRAQDVSLKRRHQGETSTASLPKRPVPKQEHASSMQPISSFSQRLAEMKSANTKKQAKSDRLEALRHATFAAKAGQQPAVPPYEPTVQPTPPSFAPSGSQIVRAPSLSPARSTAKPARRAKNSKNPLLYDPFSELHLSSRTISHEEASQQLAGSEIYTLPRLFKEVKAPEYEPPDCETDFVVFGILAEKTQPYKQQQKRNVYDKNNKDSDAVSLDGTKPKFMVLRLCDLKWQVDCFLFGTAFDKYWKLTEGSVLAILNPAIMPPRDNTHSGRFTLKVGSSDDCILEIGKARDIGVCKATRKDGTACTSWTNTAKSTLCDFHLNLTIGKARKGRMEVNTMWRHNGSPSPPPVDKRKDNPHRHRHWEHGEYWTSGGGTASLLDDEELSAFNNMTKSEASRKRIAASQRERDLATKLGAMKGGVAGEYFRTAYNLSADDGNDTASQQANFVKPTASELGLLGKSASRQRLSPAKDRKRHFGIGAISSAGTEAMGWGGARKAGLLEPPRSKLGSPERGQTTLTVKSAVRDTRGRSMSPSKKARFNLAGAIKTPGRESGGADLTRTASVMNDDNDDDLDIV